MITISRTFLKELIDLICNHDVDHAIASWRERMSREHTQCESCPYEHMLARRCCCMCLESSLGNTSLYLNLDERVGDQIRSATHLIKSHRTKGCLQCTLPKDGRPRMDVRVTRTFLFYENLSRL